MQSPVKKRWANSINRLLTRKWAIDGTRICADVSVSTVNCVRLIYRPFAYFARQHPAAIK